MHERMDETPDFRSGDRRGLGAISRFLSCVGIATWIYLAIAFFVLERIDLFGEGFGYFTMIYLAPTPLLAFVLAMVVPEPRTLKLAGAAMLSAVAVIGGGSAYVEWADRPRDPADYQDYVGKPRAELEEDIGEGSLVTSCPTPTTCASHLLYNGMQVYFDDAGTITRIAADRGL